MTTRLFRVWAVGTVEAPYIDRDGVLVMGRFAGRRPFTNEAIPEGEEVLDVPYYRQLVAQGALTDDDPRKDERPAPARERHRAAEKE